MGRAARPLHDAGNHRSIERGSDLQAARHGSLSRRPNSPESAKIDAAPTPHRGTRSDSGRSPDDGQPSQVVESPGGLSPPGAPRSVREPLDSYGSRCSAVSMAELPVGEECWIYSA